MLRYCIENRITFTRSHAYKKNDSCFVEQKNYSIVRRAVGYLRYDSIDEVDILNEATNRLSDTILDEAIGINILSLTY
jgi:hypothetical protein